MEIHIVPGTTNCRVLKIKTFPHLRKFIGAFYKLNHDGSVRVDMHTSLGIAMCKTLMTKEKIRSDQMDRMTDFIYLSLNAKLSRYSLHPRIVPQFNVEMDRIFKEHMIEWVHSQESTGTINVSEAIRNFRAQYGITENDYSTENMYRHYTRWKNDEYYKKKKSA